jgi:hypothetical protein
MPAGPYGSLAFFGLTEESQACALDFANRITCDGAGGVFTERNGHVHSVSLGPDDTVERMEPCYTTAYGGPVVCERGVATALLDPLTVSPTGASPCPGGSVGERYTISSPGAGQSSVPSDKMLLNVQKLVYDKSTQSVSVYKTRALVDAEDGEPVSLENMELEDPSFFDFQERVYNLETITDQARTHNTLVVLCFEVANAGASDIYKIEGIVQGECWLVHRRRAHVLDTRPVPDTDDLKNSKLYALREIHRSVEGDERVSDTVHRRADQALHDAIFDDRNPLIPDDEDADDNRPQGLEFLQSLVWTKVWDTDVRGEHMHREVHSVLTTPIIQSPFKDFLHPVKRTTTFLATHPVETFKRSLWDINADNQEWFAIPARFQDPNKFTARVYGAETDVEDVSIHAPSQEPGISPNGSETVGEGASKIYTPGLLDRFYPFNHSSNRSKNFVSRNYLDVDRQFAHGAWFPDYQQTAWDIVNGVETSLYPDYVQKGVDGDGRVVEISFDDPSHVNVSGYRTNANDGSSRKVFSDLNDDLTGGSAIGKWLIRTFYIQRSSGYPEIRSLPDAVYDECVSRGWNFDQFLENSYDAENSVISKQAFVAAIDDNISTWLELANDMGWGDTKINFDSATLADLRMKVWAYTEMMYHGSEDGKGFDFNRAVERRFSFDLVAKQATYASSGSFTSDFPESKMCSRGIIGDLSIRGNPYMDPLEYMMSENPTARLATQAFHIFSVLHPKRAQRLINYFRIVSTGQAFTLRRPAVDMVGRLEAYTRLNAHFATRANWFTGSSILQTTTTTSHETVTFNSTLENREADLSDLRDYDHCQGLYAAVDLHMDTGGLNYHVESEGPRWSDREVSLLANLRLLISETVTDEYQFENTPRAALTHDTVLEWFTRYDHTRYTSSIRITKVNKTKECEYTGFGQPLYIPALRSSRLHPITDRRTAFGHHDAVLMAEKWFPSQPDEAGWNDPFKDIMTEDGSQVWPHEKLSPAHFLSRERNTLPPQQRECASAFVHLVSRPDTIDHWLYAGFCNKTAEMANYEANMPDNERYEDQYGWESTRDEAKIDAWRDTYFVDELEYRLGLEQISQRSMLYTYRTYPP